MFREAERKVAVRFPEITIQLVVGRIERPQGARFPSCGRTRPADVRASESRILYIPKRTSVGSRYRISVDLDPLSLGRTEESRRTFFLFPIELISALPAQVQSHPSLDSWKHWNCSTLGATKLVVSQCGDLIVSQHMSGWIRGQTGFCFLLELATMFEMLRVKAVGRSVRERT